MKELLDKAGKGTGYSYAELIKLALSGQLDPLVFRKGKEESFQEGYKKAEEEFKITYRAVPVASKSS